MTTSQPIYGLLPPESFPKKLPDHTELPDSDGTFVKNFQEHPQSIVLTDSIKPRLDTIHPDGHYAIGQDSGVYWRIIDPPERGAVSPDWFYVPDVTPLFNGQPRRSYVMWQEFIPPLIVLEFVSGNGDEERDRTPHEGKFWVYERVIRPAFYGIYEVKKAAVEVYELVAGRYRLMPANTRGHYPIAPLGVELGIWQGSYLHLELPWLRWWDAAGNLLLLGEERAQEADERCKQAEAQREQAEAQREQADAQREQAEGRVAQAEGRAMQAEDQLERLAEYLRLRGIDPGQI